MNWPLSAFLDSDQGQVISWPTLVRHAIGTDDKVFLYTAADRCDNEAVQEFLVAIADADTQGGRFNGKLHDLAVSSASHVTPDEAVLLELLWRRFQIQLWLHNVHARATEAQQVERTIQQHFSVVMSLVETHQLDECRAYFMFAMAQYWECTENWEYASNTAKNTIPVVADVLTHQVATSSRPIALAYSVAAGRCVLCASEYCARAGDERTSMWLLDMLSSVLRDYNDLSKSRASLLRDIATELIRRRRFTEAVKWSRRAIAEYRQIAEEHPSRQTLYDYTICVGSTAQSLHSAGEWQECRTQCINAVSLLRRMRDFSTPDTVGATAVIHSALAHAYRPTGRLRVVAKHFLKSAQLLEYAALRDTTPRTWGGVLVTALCNCGAISHELNDHAVAEQSFLSAMEWSSRLKAMSPYSPIADEWLANGGFALLCSDTGREQEALHFGEIALYLLAGVDHKSADRWTVAGLAWKLQVRMLELYFEVGRIEDALRVWAGLVAERVRTATDADRVFSNIKAELATLAERRCKRAVMLVAQLGTKGFYFAIIDANGERPSIARSADFAEAAVALWTLAVSKGDVDDNEWLDCAERCWASLPHEVRRHLHPDAECIVVLTGSDGFINFPWEAVRFGRGADEALGLSLELVRLPSLASDSATHWSTSSSLREQPECGVVSPWDSGLPVLVYAREEATAVAAWLRERVGRVEESNLIIGAKATPSEVRRLLGTPLDILHYAGHGEGDGDEEALVLAGTGGWATLGATAVEMERSRRSDDEHTQLVILNCCSAGRMRVYGGRRIDLAAVFLRTGATVVIASASPIGDVAGAIFGMSFHFFACQAGNRQPLSKVVIEARQFVNSCMRMIGVSAWKTWCHVAYHGRPDVYYSPAQPSVAISLIDLSKCVAALIGNARTIRDEDAALALRILNRYGGLQSEYQQ